MTARHIAAAGISLAVLVGAILLWWVIRSFPPAEIGITFRPVDFERLEGWADDDHGPALEAFLRSCAVLLNLPPDRPIGPPGRGLTAGMWRESCARAGRIGVNGSADARRFFEVEFAPVAVLLGDEPEGLFTGYFEPVIDGSRERVGRFTVPLYGKPADLVSADLGEFRDEWAGMTLVGRLEGGRLRPFETRAAISVSGLPGRAEPILWLHSDVDAFFLHIQGSGRIRLNDGTETRVGFAASNGHPYTAIGRELVARGALERDGVSMQSIRGWLEANPAEGKEVMATNARYIFFREDNGEGPRGSSAAVLTPGRSLAVDTGLLPVHVPVWLETTVPETDRQAAGDALHRLLIAQDTGSAIRGAVRGDVFWGHGPDAELFAGHMKQTGRYYLLLPHAVRDVWMSAADR